MKLLLDAQLPRRLVPVLATAGHDTIHTLDLPLANRSPDAEIVALAVREERIVVSKDADFVASFWLRRLPPKLLLVSTGNIGNDALVALFAAHLPAVESAFSQHAFVEISRTALTIHV